MLQGKRILITGAARGLGYAFAEAALRAGARVVLADILVERGRESAAELAKLGEAHFLPLDLADPASISACSDAAAAQLGGLDGLINNGAMATGVGGKMLDEYDIDLFDRVLTVNVRGTWLMTRACLPHFKAAGGGRVVNLASDTALWGAPRLIAYVASKGAVIAMTRSMARELGGDKITVNAVAPGLTKVEATEYVPQERHDLYENGRAISRAQFPEDVTGAVNFLLSDAAGFITGQMLPVNGGFVFN
jgi:NAD(P)-dependent dehydrogenase (short-subunit alcohol dehydrogenase family)